MGVKVNSPWWNGWRISIVDFQDRGLDEFVNQAPRRCVDAISAIDNASVLIAGVGLTDDDQDDDFEVVNQHSLKSVQKITRVLDGELF